MGCTNGKSYRKQQTLLKIQDTTNKLNMISNRIEKTNASFIRIKDQPIHEQVSLVLAKLNNDKIKSACKKDILVQKQQEYIILMKQYQLSSKFYLSLAVKYIENCQESFYQTMQYKSLNQLVQKLYKFTFCLELPYVDRISNKSTFEEFGDLCESQIIS